MKKHHLLAAVAVASTTVFSASKALASDAATIEAAGSGTATYDNASGAYPVVTAILSVGSQTLNGYTYSASKFAFLAADSTGSMDIYGALPTGTSFTPTVGDGVSLTGTYALYEGLPEIDPVSAITLESSGNVAPSAEIETASSLSPGTLPENIAGYLIQIDNVTISSTTATFGISDFDLTLTDSTGSLAAYYDPTSYSVANQNLFGQNVPTGSVDVVGVDEVYEGVGQFIPLDITPVPEPTTLSLFGGGALLAFVLRRRKS